MLPVKYNRHPLIHLVIFIISGSLSALYAQECATIPTSGQVSFTRNFKLADTRELKIAKGIVDIPYQFHVLRQDDRTGGIDVNILKSHIQQLNEIYLSANIRFVPLGEVNYIEDSRYYDYNIQLEDSLALEHDMDNAINIYALNTIHGGYYGYTYHPEKGRKNRIFISKDGFDNTSTFPHEMGHFFGLYHTHGKGNKIDNLSEPIGRNVDLNNNGILDCYETGDDLCDTPADPNMGLEEYREYCLDNCEIENKIPASSGDFYEPQITNLMCYNQHSNCRREFTNEQLSRISQTARNERKSLRAKRINKGKRVAGKVKFYLKNKDPMSLSLDINLYQFDKKYNQRDTFYFEIENNSNQRIYMSIINMDVEGNVYKVFPNEGDIPFLFPKEKNQPIDGYITLDNVVGREYVCLLISTYSLSSYDIVNAMKEKKGTFTQRMYQVLGKQLLPLDNVHYSDGEFVAFDGQLKKEDILPIMLEMEHGN